MATRVPNERHKTRPTLGYGYNEDSLGALLASVNDPQLAAFRRLLDDAHQGGQAKVDALVALAQRTVFVVPWPGGIEGWRTLVNRDGVAALPLFTDAATLEEAARRYGWLDARAEAPRAEVGARAALNYAVRESLAFVVIDIASPHALEVSRKEFEPLLTPAARRDSSGPYAGAGRISSSLIRAVRPTPPPLHATDAVSMHPTPPPGSLSAPRVPEVQPPKDVGFTVSTGFNDSAKAATFGGGTSVTLSGLPSPPTAALLDALTAVLRGFPEVEWACMAQASRGPTKSVPTVALRVDDGFRQRVNEIIADVRGAAEANGASVDVLLLDDKALTRSARAQGYAFYPWRK